MKRSLFLASGLASVCIPFGVLRAAKPETVVRLFDGNVVSVIPLDQYLYGVVAQEMPTSWPEAALQAQAICARTYVLQKSDPSKPFDVVPSEANQAYSATANSPAASAAVDATTGKVLRFGPAIASIVYSACCGGRTESSADAWGTLALPYLPSQACPWCMASPDYHWTRTVASADVARALPSDDAQGPSAAQLVGTVQNIRIGSTDSSGRARDVIISGTTGSTTIPAKTFRQRVGGRIVRSLFLRNIAPTSPSGSFTIAGAGYGHGVGLCQWGAKGMALAGHSAEEILNFYFPGTTLS